MKCSLALVIADWNEQQLTFQIGDQSNSKAKPRPLPFTRQTKPI